jgi:hypothetical protein
MATLELIRSGRVKTDLDRTHRPRFNDAEQRTPTA